MGESRAESKPFDEAKAAAQRLEDKEVTAAMLFCFIVDKAVDYGMKRGRADTLVNELQASGGGARLWL